jgi:hypothetical protein
MRKADAELRPTGDTGPFEDRSHFHGALPKVFLPGRAGYIPQAMDISAGNRTHGNDRFVALD